MNKIILRLLISIYGLALLGTIVTPAQNPPGGPAGDRQELISAIKHLEKKLGFRRTKNFQTSTTASAVAYRCYYTGKLELPDSYSGLHLATGTKDGCHLDAQKYDVFFYPMDAIASGKSPLSATLEHESMERFLVVVPHEDFHASKELRKLPLTWAEASATLVGFLTAQEVVREKFGEQSGVFQNLKREPDLFEQKAEIVNRFHARLKQIYADAKAGAISERRALNQKQEAFDNLRAACSAITPNPKSFNRCPAVLNNAALSFDETYTKFYPLMYQVYLAQRRQVKSTVDALQSALKTNSEQKALENLRNLTRGVGNVDSGE
jgi:hypothetical protein